MELFGIFVCCVLIVFLAMKGSGTKKGEMMPNLNRNRVMVEQEWRKEPLSINYWNGKEWVVYVKRAEVEVCVKEAVAHAQCGQCNCHMDHVCPRCRTLSSLRSYVK